jgi:hypothetical protein
MGKNKGVGMSNMFDAYLSSLNVNTVGLGRSWAIATLCNTPAAIAHCFVLKIQRPHYQTTWSVILESLNILLHKFTNSFWLQRASTLLEKIGSERSWTAQQMESDIAILSHNRLYFVSYMSSKRNWQISWLSYSLYRWAIFVFCLPRAGR